MRAILELKLKRMKQDVSLYIIMMLMAILLTFIFSKAMGGGGAKRVYITDLDNSEYSAILLDNLYKNPYSFESASQKKAVREVQRGSAAAAIIIEKGLEHNPKVQVIYASDSVEASTIKNAVATAWEDTVHLSLLQSYINENGVPITISEVKAEQNNLDKLIKSVLTITDAPNYDAMLESSFHFLMGFNIFFVTFSIFFTIGSILEDKQLKIWQRVRLAPISSIKVLLGNFLPSFAVGVCQMGIVLLVGQYLMGIRLASVGLTFLTFTCYALCITCLGLLFSALLSNPAQLDSLVPIVTVSTSMLGGCMWPLGIISSKFILTLALFMPQYWAMSGTIHAAIIGGSIADIAKSLLVLVAMAIVLFAISVLVLHKEKQKNKS